MAHDYRRLYIALFFSTLLLVTSPACEQLSDAQQGAAGSSSSLQVEIAPELDGAIKAISRTGPRPGTRNPVEASVTLENSSSRSVEILTEGRWEDARGNRYGGMSQVVVLGAGKRSTLHAGTRSEAATRYVLKVTSNTQTAEELATAPLTDPSIQIAEGYGMTFSETASDEEIPALPIRGVANGEGFVAKTVFFALGPEDRWRLEISDRAYDPTKGVAMARLDDPTVQTININFEDEPEAEESLLREMDYGGGYFQIKPSAEADYTTSWNTSLAYAVYIDRWEKGLTGSGPCGNPEIGAASGKLYISFMGTGMGPANSWVSGQFVDVPIVYCGDE